MTAIYLPKGSIMLWNGTAVTEHNREPLDVKVTRIETSQRMANGLMRKYVIADKRTWSTSWGSVPDVTSATVDGKEGGLWMENFYNTVPGAFTLKIMPLGAVTLTTSTSVVTSTEVHKLNVGDTVQLGAITSTTGVLADTTYYVRSVPSDTTLTLSATLGGSLLVMTTTGSAASLSRVYTVMFTEFSKVIKKRGRINEYSVDIALEEV